MVTTTGAPAVQRSEAAIHSSPFYVLMFGGLRIVQHVFDLLFTKGKNCDKEFIEAGQACSCAKTIWMKKKVIPAINAQCKKYSLTEKNTPLLNINATRRLVKSNVDFLLTKPSI